MRDSTDRVTPGGWSYRGGTPVFVQEVRTDVGSWSVRLPYVTHVLLTSVWAESLQSRYSLREWDETRRTESVGEG